MLLLAIYANNWKYLVTSLEGRELLEAVSGFCLTSRHVYVGT